MLCACADSAPKPPAAPPGEVPKAAPEEPAPGVVEPVVEPEAPDLAQCGDGPSCYRKAVAAYRSDRARGASLYAAACGLEHASACHQLGALYRDGLGVEADDGLARSYFEQACGLGSSRACDALGH